MEEESNPNNLIKNNKYLNKNKSIKIGKIIIYFIIILTLIILVVSIILKFDKSESCVSECSNLNERVCTDSGYKICEEQTKNCLKWFTKECESDLKCLDGICSKDEKVYNKLDIINSENIDQELGNRIELINSKNVKDKINILFIPQRINETMNISNIIKNFFYQNKTDNTVSEMDELKIEPGIGLFNTEPFSNYSGKFNVAYMSNNLNETYFQCDVQDPNTVNDGELGFLMCNDTLITEKYASFKPDYIIILFNLPSMKYNSFYTKISYININNEDYVRTFVHEFSHQFAGLADEYVYTDSPSSTCGYYDQNDNTYTTNCFEEYFKEISFIPNIDTLGCPKWCKSYDKNKLMEEQKECAAYNNEEACANANGGGECTWFMTKHPFLNTQCVKAIGYVDIGVGCEGDSKCVFGADYGQLAFNPGIDYSIMGGGEKYNKPSEDHVKSILNCCYPRKETVECNNFRNKFSNLSDSVDESYKIAYGKIVNCR